MDGPRERSVSFPAVGRLACLAVLNSLVVRAPILILLRVLVWFVERWDRVILAENNAWIGLESDPSSVFLVWDGLVPVCMAY